MNRTAIPRARLGPRQYSMANLFEWVTCCAVISAFARLVGPAAASCLIAMALAIGVGQGLLALATFAAAMLAADCVSPARATGPVTGNGWESVFVMLLAAALAGWYASRRNLSDNRAPRRDAAESP
jgi:Na+/proline symporter